MPADDDMHHLINSLTAYQKAVDTAAIVSITDKEGRIVFANDLFCEVSKYSRNELIGQNHRIINSNSHPKGFFKKLWETISSGKVWHGEIKNKAKDGTFYWVDTTIAPIFNNSGDIVQYLSIRSLITERKNLEEEQAHLIEELNHRYNDLMQFNYIVSHNIRSPVANIHGLAGMLLEESSGCSDDLLELIDHIQQSTASLIEVINDLNDILAVNKYSHQKRELVNLRDVLNSVIISLEKEIDQSGGVISIYGDGDYELLSIKSYIHSIFFNLINNAIKYRKNDERLLIDIGFEKNIETIIIKISDNGIGMDLNKVGNELFGLYKRFNFSTTGKGLGLHMTKAQINALGGKIEVESKSGTGTRFSIYLPYKF